MMIPFSMMRYNITEKKTTGKYLFCPLYNTVGIISGKIVY